MLTTDTALQLGTSATALEYSLTNELTNAVAIQNLEGVILQDALVEICGQELCDLVTREAQSHLGKIVCTE